MTAPTTPAPTPAASEVMALEAAVLLAHYAEFIREDVRANDLERHPYLPRIEGAIEDLHAFAATLAPTPPAAPVGELLAWLEAQAKASPTGISFDYVPACDGEPSGFRFMRRHHVGEPCKSIAQAVRQNGGPA